MRKLLRPLAWFLGGVLLLFLIVQSTHIGRGEFPQVRTGPDKSISYDSSRKIINDIKSGLKAGVGKKLVNEDSLAEVFTSVLIERIIPYWYGTPWDFNGYTAKPGEGVVACGYFVSTTLQHSGVKLNRYKMAQKSSMDGALMLESRDSLLIRYCSREEFLPVFRNRCADGLYMVGLSFHVGYLYKKGEEVYFIHSSYLSPTCVVLEKASESEALGQSKVFVVADITYNKSLIRKWLNNEELKH
jgi:hypothetical protein